MRSATAAATIIFVAVVVFIRAKKREGADVAVSAEADDNVAARLAAPMDASAARVVRRVTNAVPEMVIPRLLKNRRNCSMAADSSRLATLSEQPTRLAAARWVLFWK